MIKNKKITIVMDPELFPTIYKLLGIIWTMMMGNIRITFGVIIAIIIVLYVLYTFIRYQKVKVTNENAILPVKKSSFDDMLKA